jgi:hypothetical protein
MIASGSIFMLTAVDLEELSEEDLARLRAHFEALARASREDLKRGLRDTGTTELPTD